MLASFGELKAFGEQYGKHLLELWQLGAYFGSIESSGVVEPILEAFVEL